jgi:hypothetical protein
MATEPPRATIDIGNVVSRGFRTLVKCFLPFFGAAAILSGIPGFFNQYTVVTYVGDSPFYVTSLAIWSAGIGAILGYFLLQGFVVRSSILHMSGRDPDFAGSVVAALKLFLPMLGIAIVSGIVIMIGFLLLIVPGVMLYIILIVSVPALVEERRGVFGSMRRSRDLTRGSRWLILLLVILFYVASIIVSILFNTVAGVSMFGVAAGNMPDPRIAGLAAGLSSSLTGVFVAVMLASLYVELRTVKEGETTDTLAGIFE